MQVSGEPRLTLPTFKTSTLSLTRQTRKRRNLKWPASLEAQYGRYLWGRKYKQQYIVHRHINTHQKVERSTLKYFVVSLLPPKLMADDTRQLDQLCPVLVLGPIQDIL